MEKINLREKLSQFSDHWNPRIIGEMNGQHVKLAKFQGEFVWHHHEEDELFMVLKGTLLIKFRNNEDILLKEGEMIIVPAKIEHMPVATEEVHVLLFEPISTRNTGNVVEERTRH